ncbi:MAG: alpha/beta hydrolase [Candidatus Binatia bacterium]
MGVALFQRRWGTGPPVIALHPLGLESFGFAGVGRVLARRGLQTIAVDLPGFGRSPAPPGPLTPAVLAEPVIALARALDEPPVVLGISLGGRVALEVALRAPEAVRAVIPIAPALPRRRYRALLAPVRLLDPRLAEWLPLERVWPFLRWLARTVETVPYLRDDELAQAGARLVYYFACPATRQSFLSAAREMILEPAFGPDGFWDRLPRLAVPALFVWGERDRLISTRYAHHVARVRPDLPQLLLPCVAHWLNGPHHRCLAEALAGAVAERGRRRRRPRAAAAAETRIGAAVLRTGPCVVSVPRRRPAARAVMEEG